MYSYNYFYVLWSYAAHAQAFLPYTLAHGSCAISIPLIRSIPIYADNNADFNQYCGLLTAWQLMVPYQFKSSWFEHTMYHVLGKCIDYKETL